MTFEKLPWLLCWTLGVLKIQLLGKNLHKRTGNFHESISSSKIIQTKNYKISGGEKDLYWGEIIVYLQNEVIFDDPNTKQTEIQNTHIKKNWLV